MQFRAPVLHTLELAEDVTKIFTEFQNNTKLETLVIPTSVKTIAKGAFQNCTALQTVHIQGVQKIDQHTFRGCTSLQTIIFDKTVVDIAEGAFANCTSLVKLYLPHTLQKIGSLAFQNCTLLNALDFGKSKRIAIAENAFQNCSALHIATLPPFADVADNAFAHCTKLMGRAVPKLTDIVKNEKMYEATCGEASRITWKYDTHSKSWEIISRVPSATFVEQEIADAEFFRGCQRFGKLPGGTVKRVFLQYNGSSVEYVMPENTEIKTVKAVGDATSIEAFLQLTCYASRAPVVRSKNFETYSAG